MTLHVPRPLFSLDPLMAEAKRRARQRRMLLAGAALVGAALALALFLALGTGGSGSSKGQSRGAGRSSGASGSSAGQLASLTVQGPVYFVSGGGIRKPPGGAELRHKHRLIAQRTSVGPAAIWVAPDWAVRGTCAWLMIGRAVYGGECRRFPTPRGLWEVVPLRLPIRGHFVTLLWGHAGRDVANLKVKFQDGAATRLPVTDGVFFHVLPKQRWVVGHRPAALVARGTDGRVVRVRLITNSRLVR